jgi:hypothetical protein
MLAYVFWHWKRPAVERGSYEAAQRRFHEALAEAPPPGFRGSWISAVEGTAWLPAQTEGYEDWYLLEGSASLDPLNEAAVTASRQQPHDAAAALAAGGTAGLYRLRAGGVLRGPAYAFWFAKPEGMPYAELFARAGAAASGVGHALWVRQMVLGPSPECCLQTNVEVVLPWPLACVVAMRRVW